MTYVNIFLKSLNIYHSKLLVVLSLLTFSLVCCEKESSNFEYLNISDEEAKSDADEIRQSMPVTTATGLDVSLWASEKLLGDPIAIHMDNEGQAWITVTNRSYNSEFDIRALPEHWRAASLSWESVEDRRDFLRNELSPENSTNNTFVWDHNQDGSHDWLDLTIMKEEVWRIQDLTGDGLANQAQLFIRDFNEEITDVAGAIVYHDGNLFLGVGPDMWRIRDTNNNGIGDWKESISHGYNVHLGNYGHGMSGAMIGPDGRLYWSIGDMGFNIIDRDGKHWYSPHHGAILRSELDGSNFEVYASGLRNTHEFVFDKYGNLITVDNDGDYAGEFERLVYLVNGSDSGWRINWQYGKYTDPKNNSYNVWMEEGFYRPHFDDQAAHVLPPISRYHDGPAGMAYNPGTALSEEWKDHFFLVSFRGSVTNSPIYAFTLEPSGASFKLSSDQEVMRGLLPVGLDFGPDGALYMTDWVEGWRKNEMGRIWKLDTPSNKNSPIREETKKLLEKNFDELTSGDLIEQMSHDDMRVRQKAQFELANRDDFESLLSVIEQSDSQLARIHGIWGIAQIGRKNINVVDNLMKFLVDDDPEIRAQSAKMLGDVRYEPAASSIVPLLNDEFPRVRFFAAEALGRIEYDPAFSSIVEMLEENNEEDIYLRHAGAIAFSRLNDVDSILSLASHPSRAVRIAAVVALKKMNESGVVKFLQDEDEYIVTNAARIINDDDFIDEAMPELARMLEQTKYINEPLIRRAINANLYEGSITNARRLVDFALNREMPVNLRVESLNTLKNWENPSVFDRVSGRYRGNISNDSVDVQQVLEPIVNEFLEDEDIPDVIIAITEAAAQLNITQAIPGINNLLLYHDSPNVRIAALSSLHVLQYDSFDEAISIALEDDDQYVRMNALTFIPNLELDEYRMVELLISTFEHGSIEEKQTILGTLENIKNEMTNSFFDDQLEQLLNGELNPEIILDLVIAAENFESETIQTKLIEYGNIKDTQEPVNQFEETLYGGDYLSGERIFYQNASAQCIRCHVVNGQGGDVGPDLSDVGNRLNRVELLQSMVDPNGRISFGYGMVVLTLHDGSIINGLLKYENDNSVIVMSGDMEYNVDFDQIDNRINISSMPQMGEILTRRELRDLVEYMSNLTN